MTDDALSRPQDAHSQHAHSQDAQLFAHAADRPPIFDRSELDANTLSDLSLQRELFDLYFGQAPSLFDKLEASSKSGEETPWREAAHALKGTARTLGLMRLGDVAAEAEDSAPDPEALKRLADIYAMSVGAAQAYLGAAASAA